MIDSYHVRQRIIIAAVYAIGGGMAVPGGVLWYMYRRGISTGRALIVGGAGARGDAVRMVECGWREGADGAT